VRGRLFGLAGALILLGAVCVVVATSGLIGQKGKVHAVDTTFKTFRTERDAYEGWLTADDQMNMYAALAVLQDPSQRQLANVTWNQVVQGHAQAIGALGWLIAHAANPSVRSKAQTTLADLTDYYTFTQRMHDAVLHGNPRLAVRLVTVNNAPASNRTQADFDAMGQTLSAEQLRAVGHHRRPDHDRAGGPHHAVAVALDHSPAGEDHRRRREDRRRRPQRGRADRYRR
jgi:hypothetical protein